MSVIEELLNLLLAGRKLPLPRIVHIEPVGNMCQLKCPLCPVGREMLKQDRTMMSMDTYRVILDKLPFVKTIELYRSGEPFINPALCEMTRYASDRNIKVIVSSHFSFPKPDQFFEEIVKSGLDRLVISLDGASQESYSQYRIGGNYDLVISNIKKLIEAKKRLHSSKPEIIWQLLVNKFNEHEIAAAQDISGRLGIALDLKPISLADNEPDVGQQGTIQERKDKWLPQNPAHISDCYKGEYRYPLSPGICTELFTRAVVTADGKVLPCCEIWDNDSMFGDLLTEAFKDIWYSQKYLAARARFLNKHSTPRVQSACFKCNNFGTTPTLRDKVDLLLAVYRKKLRFW